MAHLKNKISATDIRSISLAGIFLLSVSLFSASSLHAQAPGSENNNRPDEVGTGAYPSIKEEVSSLPEHVIYRPENLAALGGQKLGVVAWGNGGCSPDGASSRFHLAELASHGFLVIANGKILSGPGAPDRDLDESESGADGTTSAEQLIETIDWALSENARPGSAYYGLIDDKQIAVSGFSCGGVQAIDVADDPRIDTLVLMNTGLFANDGEPILPGMDVPKEDLKNIHTSVIYIQGGETDIAWENGFDDYQRISQVPIALASLPVGHGGTYHETNGGSAAQVAVSWLKWQLRGDNDAALNFVGPNCGLCQDKEWSLMSKGLD